MKVLVFDDTRVHQQSAELSLKGHDVIVVGTYDQAQRVLAPVIDYDKAKGFMPELLVKAGLPAEIDPNGEGVSQADRDKYWQCDEESKDLARPVMDREVVLTDLFVPASYQALGPKSRREHGGKGAPLGSTIALLALSVGVENVAVVTDMNHHDHPASAAFDHFGKCKSPHINLVCTNRPKFIAIDKQTGELVDKDFLDSDDGKKKYPYPDGQIYGQRNGLVWGKDWGHLLDRLMKRDKE